MSQWPNMEDAARRDGRRVVVDRRQARKLPRIQKNRRQAERRTGFSRRARVALAHHAD